MFQFTLVKDRSFVLTLPSPAGAYTHAHANGVTRSMFTSVETIGWVDNNECRELSELKELVDGYRLANEMWHLRADVVIGVTQNLSLKPRDFILLTAINGTSPSYKDMMMDLKQVLGAHGWHLKLSVEIWDFGCENGDGGKANFWTSDEHITESFPARLESNLLRHSGALERSLWQDEFAYTGVITVNCIAYRSGDSLPKICFPERGPVGAFILRKMLHEGLYSDVVITSKEGENIKSHQSILNFASDAFKRITLTCGVIKMDEMRSKSVKALLAYLYVEEIEKAVNDCSVAFDLYVAAGKYSLPKMGDKMKDIISCKPEGWISTEVALRLYLHVKDLDDGEALKKKAILALIKNFDELKKLRAYIQLFHEEPGSAKQLVFDILTNK